MRGEERGFTLVEVILVVTLVFTCFAIAAPTLLSSLRRYQLESSARNVSSILMRARYEAIRKNQRIPTIYSTGNPGAYGVDLNNDGILQSTEPSLPLFNQVQMVATGFPALTSMGTNYSSAAVPSGFQVSFASVGTAMQQAGTSWIEANSVSVIPLRHSVTLQWAAVTVTPAGRFRVWFWNGTAWVS